MNFHRYIPALARLYFWHLLFLLGLQEATRVVMHIVFFQDLGTWSEVFETHWLGMRFDLRYAIVFAFPLLLVGLPGIRYLLYPFKKFGDRRFIVRPIQALIVSAYFTILVLLWVLIACFDFGNYAYLHQRIDATFLVFLKDWRINLGVMWDAYPVVWVSFGLLVLAVVSFFTSILMQSRIIQSLPKRKHTGWGFNAIFYTALVFFSIWGAYGGSFQSRGNLKWSETRLTWSDIAYLENKQLASLAINAVQQIKMSLGHRFDEKVTKTSVQDQLSGIASWLGESSSDSVFNRPWHLDRDSLPIKMPIPENVNVVLIVLESFATYQSSLINHQTLDTTPFIRSLSDQGWYLPHFGSMNHGTAKGIYALLTSWPDVSPSGHATRVPSMTNHRSYVSDFSGYQKFYFVGGDASWQQLRFLITKSIEDVRLYEVKDFLNRKAQTNWGISDRDLFSESIGILNRASDQGAPFFAIIQTSDNHIPFPLPEETLEGHELLDLDESALKKNGFRSNDHLNAVRLLDYNVKRFFEKAKKTKWFDNTIFVLLGDHGASIDGYSTDLAWLKTNKLRLMMTGLILYAPQFLEPNRFSEIWAQQVDLLPTLVALLDKKNISLRTIGSNFFDERGRPKGMFWLDQNAGDLGWFNGRYLSRHHSKDPSMISLYDLSSHDETKDISKDEPALAKNLSTQAQNYYDTSRYGILQNTIKRQVRND